jgi:predicted phosphodiesterase
VQVLVYTLREAVRILVLSDIHANLEALQACLDAAPEFDLVFNLGDIVGYGANPNEVTARVRDMGSIFVRGNHDKACTGLESTDGFNPIAERAVTWTQQQLSADNLDFLRTLPAGPVAPLENMQCVHGSARDEDEYIVVAREAYPLLVETTVRLTFFGHTHIQCGFAANNDAEVFHVLVPRYQSRREPERETVHLDGNVKYLINPGSVGQPRDNDPRAAFAFYDTEEDALTFFRIPYDIAAAQKKILAAGLPGRLASRLAEGL